jgi:hypothetical protein
VLAVLIGEAKLGNGLADMEYLTSRTVSHCGQPLQKGFFHLALVRVNIGERVVHLDNVQWTAVGNTFRIRRIQTVSDLVDNRGKRVLPDLTQAVQILTPSLRLWKRSERQVSLAFTSDIRWITD